MANLTSWNRFICYELHPLVLVIAKPGDGSCMFMIKHIDTWEKYLSRILPLSV